MQVGSKAGAKAQAVNDLHIAAVLRENQLLRDVAEAAIRLRSVGRAYDKVDEGMQELWRDNPDLTKSGTPLLMANEAFETAMKRFDDVVLVAFEAGMEWARTAPKPSLVKD